MEFISGLGLGSLGMVAGKEVKDLLVATTVIISHLMESDKVSSLESGLGLNEMNFGLRMGL